MIRKQGILHIDDANITELVEQYDTPLFVFSERSILENIRELKEAFPTRTRIHYASKANSNLAILQIVKKAGIDIEVNSGGELYKALKAGFAPGQIVFNGVAKTEREIQEAVDSDIFCINVDSLYELQQIQKIAQRSGKCASIALRLIPDVEAKTHNGLETGTATSKFGMMAEKLVEAYHFALAHAENLNLIGLHVHVGAQIGDATIFRKAFQTLLIKTAELYAETGYCVSHLNIGGGLAVPFIHQDDAWLQEKLSQADYRMYRANLDPDEVANLTINNIDDDLMSRLNAIQPEFLGKLADMTYILEPGTRIIANTAIMVTAVQNQKKHHNDTWLLLDAGFNVLADILAYTWFFEVAAVSSCEPHETAYKLGGPLCDGGDTHHDMEHLYRLPQYRFLPNGMKPNDTIAFFDVGGYTLEQMNQYNGQPRPAAVLVRDNGLVALIRKRESYEELCHHDVLLDG